MRQAIPDARLFPELSLPPGRDRVRDGLAQALARVDRPHQRDRPAVVDREQLVDTPAILENPGHRQHVSLLNHQAGGDQPRDEQSITGFPNRVDSASSDLVRSPRERWNSTST